MKKVIASILTIVLSIPLFLSTPLAEAHGPNNIVYTPYGTCTSEFYYEANSAHNITIGGVTIPQQGPVNVVRYTFTHPYTGTFDLDITISGVLSNIWNLMTSNCYLLSVVDETTLRFAVNNAEYCEIAIMPSQYYNQLVFFLENQNLTPVEDTTTAVNDILTHVSFIDGQIQQIKADTTMIRNLIISMSGYTVDSNDNIATDMDTLISAMQEANTISTDINNALKHTNIYDNIVYQLIENNPRYQSSTSTGYVRLYGDQYKYISDNNTSNVNYYNSFTVPAYTDMSFVLFVDRGLSSNYRLYSNGCSISRVVYEIVGGVYLYELIINNPTSARVECSIEFTEDLYLSPVLLCRREHMPQEIQNLLGIDIADKYTNRLEAIKRAIENMSMNVNQLTVNATGITYNVNNTQVDNSVTTYNTNINQVYNVENDFGTQLDTQLQNYNPDNTNIISRLTASGNIMTTVLNGINGIELFTVPISVMLVGIVLLAIVG